MPRQLVGRHDAIVDRDRRRRSRGRRPPVARRRSPPRGARPARRRRAQRIAAPSASDSVTSSTSSGGSDGIQATASSSTASASPPPSSATRSTPARGGGSRCRRLVAWGASSTARRSQGSSPTRASSETARAAASKLRSSTSTVTSRAAANGGAMTSSPVMATLSPRRPTVRQSTAARARRRHRSLAVGGRSVTTATRAPGRRDASPSARRHRRGERGRRVERVERRKPCGRACAIGASSAAPRAGDRRHATNRTAASAGKRGDERVRATSCEIEACPSASCTCMLADTSSTTARSPPGASGRGAIGTRDSRRQRQRAAAGGARTAGRAGSDGARRRGPGLLATEAGSTPPTCRAGAASRVSAISSTATLASASRPHGLASPIIAAPHQAERARARR